MSSKNCNPLTDEATNIITNTYCIVLNIKEATGFDLKYSFRSSVILEVSLNGVKFGVEGNLSHLNVITFNSNCIWECELEDVKRIKMDNRPIKMECFIYNDRSESGSTNHVGSLLMGLRTVKIINSLKNLQHKSSTGERSINMLSNISETSSMLQSQQGLYIQFLEEVGQIQIRHDPLQDNADIFSVTLTFRKIINILSLMNIIQTSKELNKQYFVLQYDFLGSMSKKEIVINTDDCFTINQKVSLCFRSSLQSLRLYFQRVFYIPMHLYYMGEFEIAKCNFDISSFLPNDTQYFNEEQPSLWTKYGSFPFDILTRIPSPGTLQPLVDFIFTLELLPRNVTGKYSTREINYTTIHEDTWINQEMQLAVEPRTRMIKNCEINNLPTKSVCEVAVNTENQCEGEKCGEEKIYIQELQAEWQNQRHILIEAKITKCEQLLSQLENTQMQLNDLVAINLKNASITGNILREIEASYELKIKKLETNIQCLSIKIQEIENQNMDLMKRTDYLEKQFKIHQRSYLSLDQLRDALNEMRKQADRLTATENFHKEQCLTYLRILKKHIFKIMGPRKISTNFDLNFCLEELFCEEKTNPQFASSDD